MMLCQVSANEEISLEELGQDLFFNINISKYKNQSCATCHSPALAFSDPKQGKVSLGSDDISKGTRNSPSISYAALSPTFYKNKAGAHVGGFFYDGRATSAAHQIRSTLLSPTEMAMQSEEEVINRLKENYTFSKYLAQQAIVPEFSDIETQFNVVLTALTQFQKGKQFLKFNSKYDRSLVGKYTLSPLEERGRSLFFSDVTNCMHCHHLSTHTTDKNQIFSDHLYHNIGVPSVDDTTPPDEGLANNPRVKHENGLGKFKTPSLRNVAVTAPYMHNGVFRELETAIHFYNQHIVDREIAKINPETGKLYGAPDITENIAFDLLQKGQPLSKNEIDALVAFLKTLTDQEFEYLLTSH
jgi:cytochrome c peroxidase